MAQTGYTPILIYSSSTTSNIPAAGNLTNSTLGSELAINITDGKLFYKDNSNNVQVIGWKTTPTTAGGTGLTSYTAGDLLYYATGTTLSKLAIGASTTILTSSGTAPQWSAASGITVGTATNIAGGAAGSVPYQTGAGATSLLAIGTAYYMLGVNAGATAPSWQPSSTSTLTAQGDLLYASAANTLARLAKNTTATRYLANTGTNNNPAWAQIDLTNGVTGALPAANGGTGQSSYAVGDILYASASTTLSKLAGVATGNALISGGVTTAPSWGKIGLTTHVSGTLPTANGGTNLTSFTANGVMYASSTSALTTGTGLQFDGTSLGVGIAAAARLDVYRATGQTSGTYEIARFEAGSPGDGGSDFGGFLSLGNNNGTTYKANAALVWAIDAGQTGFGWVALQTANNGTLANAIKFDYNRYMYCSGVYSATVGGTNRDVYVDNSGLVGYVSSLRESKTEIENFTDISWLQELNPVSFKYRKKDKNGNYTDETDGNIQYGMIAEDVEQIRPDLCFYDETENGQELRGIQYSKLIVPMLKLIQQQQLEINQLKQKVGL